jgi:hypothetical protein
MGVPDSIVYPRAAAAAALIVLGTPGDNATLTIMATDELQAKKKVTALEVGEGVSSQASL